MWWWRRPPGYDTVGYEYTVVDGAGYGSNGGRIRLHEVTEGTMVRWTFNYELNGVLGGIRNAVRKKRSARRQIQDSLRNLHELVLQEAGGITTHEAKASVREAPDAEQRSSYQPRHPSAFSDTGAMHASPLDGGAVDPEQAMILEPALEPSLPPAPADGDTKPNPVVQISGAMAAAPPLPAPEADSTEPIEMDLIRFEPAAAADEDEPLEPAPAPIAAEPDPIPPPEPVPFRRALDTSTVSVFEVFGFQKPSEAKLADASAEPVDDMDRFSEKRRDWRFDAYDINPGLDDDVPAPADAGNQTVMEKRMGWRRSRRRRARGVRSQNA